MSVVYKYYSYRVIIMYCTFVVIKKSLKICLKKDICLLLTLSANIVFDRVFSYKNTNVDAEVALVSIT